MINNLMRDKYTRLKLLEDAISYNYRRSKIEQNKRPQTQIIDKKTKEISQLKIVPKTEEKARFSSYKKLSDKIRSSNNVSPLLADISKHSRNISTGMSSTANISKNMSFQKLHVDNSVTYILPNQSLNQAQLTSQIDYSSVIKDYKASVAGMRARGAQSSLAGNQSISKKFSI